MITNFSELILIFAAYSILGWTIKSLVYFIEERKFVKQGFLYGPYIPIYGFGVILNLIITQSFAHNPILVFIVFFSSMTIIELLSGLLFERLFNVKLWDYKKRKFNFKGHTYLTNSISFGAMGVLAVYVLNPIFHQFFLGINHDLIRLWMSIFLAIIFLDLARSLVYASDFKAEVDAYKASLDGRVDFTNEEILLWIDSSREEFQRNRYKIGNKVRDTLDYILQRSKEKKLNVIDSYEGLDSTKIIWIFLIGCVAGYIVETLFCLVTIGTIESRQGMIYGPFSQIYGFGAILMVLTLTPLAKRGDSWLFMGGAFVGGIYEAICSVIQENTIGSVSWEYANHAYPLLGGRTSVVYMLFWGILAVVYMRIIYPYMDKLVNRIPFKVKHFFTWIILVTLLLDLTVSGLAVNRWADRVKDIPPSNEIEIWLDYKYPNELLQEIYPRMKLKR